MNSIQFVEREMTDTEFKQMNAGFDEHSIAQGNPIQTPERFSFVVLNAQNFAGCASGLAYKANDVYNKWFYLSDLFIEKSLRGKGLGTTILGKLEEKVMTLGIEHIWTWTVGEDAIRFYKNQGYTVFCELEDWFVSGQGRVGLRKFI